MPWGSDSPEFQAHVANHLFDISTCMPHRQFKLNISKSHLLTVPFWPHLSTQAMCSPSIWLLRIILCSLFSSTVSLDPSVKYTSKTCLDSVFFQTHHHSPPSQTASSPVAFYWHFSFHSCLSSSKWSSNINMIMSLFCLKLFSGLPFTEDWLIVAYKTLWSSPPTSLISSPATTIPPFTTC